MTKTKIYFWLKIDKKFFDNIFIKRLKTIPGGYTMTVIYIRLMLESLESDCILYYEGYFETIKEELALKLDVSEDDIEMTMAYFTKCGLIQIDEDKNAELSQAKALVQQETNQAAYMRGYRKEQREKNKKLTMLSDNLTTLTTCKTEIEIEKEKEIEKEIDIESEVDTVQSATDENVFDHYQSRIGSIDGYQVEQLQNYLSADHLEPELVKRAIDRAADNGKRSFGYVNAILKSWAQSGIRTVAQQDEEQRNFTDSKAKKKTGSFERPEYGQGYDPELGF